MLTKLKIWLVLLLALILPLKGAMATAGMLCHMPASLYAQPVHGHASHDAGQATDAYKHHNHEQQRTASDRGDAGVNQLSCLACAAMCGASPVPANASLRLPTFEPARDWPGLALLEPPSRTLAGLERPPRSI